MQHYLSIFPPFDPRRLQPLTSLASNRHVRYRLSRQREDLGKEIVHLTELILLLSISQLQRGHNIFRALLTLANTLLFRSLVSKQPEDAICGTKYLSHLRDQPHEIPGLPRHQVTTSLVHALTVQVELEAENLSMADVPGEFMITSGSRPFRARLVRSVLTDCLQDLSTKSIFPSHDCRSFSLFYLDLILVAFNICFFWPESRANDTYGQNKGNTSTRQWSITPN